MQNIKLACLFQDVKIPPQQEISPEKFWKQVEMLKEFGEDGFLHGQFWMQLSYAPKLDSLENILGVIWCSPQHKG